MSLGPIAKLILGIKRAAKPAMSDNLQRLYVQSEQLGPGELRGKDVARFAREESLQDFVEPHNRRQFFRNIVGLPHRTRQIEAVRTAPFYNSMEYADSLGALDEHPESLERLAELRALHSAIDDQLSDAAISAPWKDIAEFGIPDVEPEIEDPSAILSFIRRFRR